jgi:methylated-DNA-[protein]-cysteine S-methyltransferase
MDTTTLVYDTIATPLGEILLAANETGLTGIWFDAQQYFPKIAAWKRDAQHVIVREASAQLKAYFAGELTRFEIALAPEGTVFQKNVWQQISRVAFAQTCAYGAIAHALEKPSASRAVGAATGRNPLSIVVPCHRVVGSNGALTGYAGGMARKVQLLAHEKCIAQGLRHSFLTV